VLQGARENPFSGLVKFHPVSLGELRDRLGKYWFGENEEDFKQKKRLPVMANLFVLFPVV